MSSSAVLTKHARVTRRRLTHRQADTVSRLLDAAVVEVRATGYDGLTVRNVARRAGVAPATAYTYFASKDHLVAEVFWRLLRSLPPPSFGRRRSAASRVAAAVEDLGALVGDQPELAAACTTALLAGDPDVKQLRDRIGSVIADRLVLALDEAANPRVLQALLLAYSGAMVQAGMGHLAYDQLAGQLADVADLVLGGRP